MAKSILRATALRLSETDEGLVLLGLIETHGSPNALAEATGIPAQWVRQWCYDGRVSKQGAIDIAEKLGLTKERIRPDVPAEGWAKKEVEPKPPRNPVARNEDARLLVELAEKFGSVRKLCDAAFCHPGDYHTWKTRGRIPAIKLPTFLALKQKMA